MRPGLCPATETKEDGRDPGLDSPTHIKSTFKFAAPSGAGLTGLLP